MPGKRLCGERSARAHAMAGFTLLEVLVAVIVLGLVMFAIITAGTRYADSAGYMRDKTLALWVAHNRLTEIELEPVFPQIGKSDDTVTMGGERWRWKADVKETPDPNLRRVDIRVYRANDGDFRTSYATLSAFISRMGRQTVQ
jgi:general secretion pathway protein I